LLSRVLLLLLANCSPCASLAAAAAQFEHFGDQYDGNKRYLLVKHRLWSIMATAADQSVTSELRLKHVSSGLQNV
jgi:hypothetical protein